MAKQTVIFFCFLLSATCLSAPTSEANPSNVTVTVESVPVKPGSASFLQRLNVRVGSAWSKFKCQFYSKATVPVAKMLNVNVPSALDLANVTNCVQLNAIVNRLTANATDEGQVTATTQMIVESTTVSQETTTSGESTTKTGTTSESSANEGDITSESSVTAASEEASTSAGETAAPPETTMASTSDDTSQSTIAESDNSDEPSVKPVADAQN